MNLFEERSKLPLYGLIAVLVGLILYFWWTRPEPVPIQEATEVKAKVQEDENHGIIVVHVAGAVYKPGVYNLKEGSRIKDAVEIAQGMLPLADDSSINLAAKITDGQKIYIPFKNEKMPATTPNGFSNQSSGATSSNPAAKININTATGEELDKLPGVGPATAAKIIEYREQNGAFAAIEDLKKVKGIGDKKFEDLKDYITVN